MSRIASEANDATAPGARASTPVYIDVDGTLTRTDLLVECALRLLWRQPWMLLAMIYWLFGGKAALKAHIAERVTLNVALLPYSEAFVDWLRAQSAAGRRLVLASAGNERTVNAVAAHFGLFCDVLASNAQHNLAGTAKLRAIRLHAGDEPFVYAGNGPVDLEVWGGGAAAVLVNPSRGLEAAARAVTTVEAVFETRRRGVGVWLRAIRLHQWLKNLLIGVPLITAFRLQDIDAWIAATLAFVAFGLVASATYLFNDLGDLDADRRHPRKRSRPLAAGDVSLLAAIVAAIGMLLAGLALAAWVSLSFLLVLAAYLVTTVAYSLHLKRLMLMDVLCLAGLYTLRIVAGAVAIGVELSNWLLAFSMFLFLSLALVKRCAELVSLQSVDRPAVPGRDYRAADLPVFLAMGVASGFMSVLVLALFIDIATTVAQYAHARWLWLLCPVMLYWVGRLWVKTTRGEMHDDPIVYSLRDRASWLCLVALAGIAWAAR